MKRKRFFKKIDFNKPWDETDWEKFFRAQDDYRLSKTGEIRKKPKTRIKFEGTDEVLAFEPVLREYGVAGQIPSVMHELNGSPFAADGNPDDDYYPATDEDPHYWGEGAPLSNLLIYRDCCRFAICTANELERYLKRRDMAYRRKMSAESESLRFHANWIAINLAQGHTIGYAEERVRGNIAKCLRAIKHADVCVSLVGRISLKTQSMRLRRELFGFAAQLRNALYDWVDELRQRFT